MPSLSPARAAALAALPAFAAGAWLALSYPPNHDVSWLMYVAGRWLEGARLYRDVIEVNPPLVVWLTALPQAVAAATGAWPASVYRVFVLALAALSLLFAGRLLRVRFHEVGAGAASAMAAVASFAVVAGPRYEFGQREHLAVLLVLPYLALVAERLRAEGVGGSRAAGIGAGVMAGIGFALKPYFLAAWLLPELYVLLRRGRAGWLRPELAALLATFLAYGLAILLLAPDYLPFARLAAGGYGDFASSPYAVLLQQRAARIGGLALLAWLVLRWRSPLRAPGDVLALALLGFALGVLAQRKGWFYHWIPVRALAALLFALAAERVLAPVRGALGGRRAWEGAVALGAVVASLLLVLPGAGDVRVRREAMAGRAYQLPHMVRTVRQYARGGPIAALSTNPQAAFPLLDYVRLPWALRFNALWLLPGAYSPDSAGRPFPYRAPDRMGAAERFQYEAVLTDLLRTRPTLLAVDRTPPGYVLRGFSYLEYFGQDPRFLRFLDDYREFPPVERYRILVRVR